MLYSRKGENFIISAFVILIIILVFTIARLSGNISERNDILFEELTERLRLHGNLVSEFFTYEMVNDIQTEADTQQVAHLEVEQRLRAYVIENDLSYIYFLRLVEHEGEMYFQYVWDTDASERHYHLNDLHLLAEEPNIEKAFQGITIYTEPGVYVEGWEGLISTYRPVFTMEGQLFGVLGIDLSDQEIMNTITRVNATLQLNIFGIVAITMIGVLIIITYRKKVRDTEEANIAKTYFLSNMSHELRTPLTAVIGMLDMIDKSNDLEKIKDYYVVKMKIASQNLLQNINDILDISKIEEGKMSMLNYRFNIEDVFRSIFDVMEVAAAEKKIDIHIHMQADMKHYFNGDAKRLSQVYMNLLSNAIKFTKEGGTIEIEVACRNLEDRKVEISSKIKDNGIGIPKNKLSSLFNHFYQVDNSLSRKYTGSGIGLVIVKTIVEMMGGTIRVESEENKGTTFSFNIILEESEPQEETEIGTDIFNVLVIDDAPEVCRYISDLFNVKKIKHKIAYSGEESIKLVQAEQEAGQEFNVILADYLMPGGMNGIETVKALQRHVSKDVIILMISSTDWSNIEEDAKAAGVKRFLQKPLLPSDIINAMSELSAKKIYQIKKKVENQYDFSGKRILLVEDNETNREVAQFILADTGVVFDEAEDGVKGVAAYMENPDRYDLILMDIQMPNMDGFAATKCIRTSKMPNAMTIPIVAMTANVFIDQVAEALDAGMDGHIGKPIDAREMKETLSKYLQ